MNHHLRLASGTPAKLEHASLTFEITDEHLEKPHYIFFRALNFTDDGTSHKASEGCLTLYLEAEFRAQPTQCRHDPALNPSNDIQTLRIQNAGTSTGFGWQSSAAGHSISDSSQTFFTYQDFYLPEDRQLGDAPYEVAVSLQQKFHEDNALDIMVEVL